MQGTYLKMAVATVAVLTLTATPLKGCPMEHEDAVKKVAGTEIHVGPVAGANAEMAMILAEAGQEKDLAGDMEPDRDVRAGLRESAALTDVEMAAGERLTAYFGYIPTNDELDLFYRTVQAECGYLEPDAGVGAVADVIANRCRSETFPDTITEVITQKNQFATWDNGMIEAAEPSDQVYEICDDHISEGAVYTDIYYFTAGGYNPYCQPAFVIGHHYFGR